MAVFVTHEIFREPAWGALHPLSIARQGALLDLCKALGWLPSDAIKACDFATFEQLSAYHCPQYVDALRQASATGKASAEARQLYNFGTMENPLFPRVYERAAASVGGAICAADEALRTGRAFHPAGGTHHGKKAAASGFCYFNDPVFAILTLLEAGATPVLYVDIDAHHGDGVEAAFGGDERVFLVSVHEGGRWPYTGRLDDDAPANVRNLPTPAALNDSEFAFLVEHAVRPLAERLQPASIVIVAGADCLAGDPLSSMTISNVAFWAAVERLCSLAPVQVVLGGGGYNPWTTVRAWAGLWGRLSGRDIPAALPEAASALLAGMSCDLIDDDERDPGWTTALSDAPNTGPVRPAISALADASTRRR